MAIVTLLTDSGGSDHYVASIKARILGVNPGIRIVDLSHQIKACDIGHGAFVLRSVFRDFPKGTVHLVGVNSGGSKNDLHIALQLEDHFFVGTDNGFFGLLSEKNHQQIAELSTGRSVITTFPERDVFAHAAAKLASGVSLTDLGRPLQGFKRLIDRQVRATKRAINGQVVRVDHFGNLITNIPREVFDSLSKDKGFTIQFGGEKFRKIFAHYNQVEEGDCVTFFNSLGYLEIAINKGNASELLGLEYDSAVNVIFDE